MKEKEDSSQLVQVENQGDNGQLQKVLEKLIEVNGDRMTPEMLQELISENPDRVCSALRSWTLTK